MEDVNFKWSSPAIDLANNIELPQFKLKGFQIFPKICFKNFIFEKFRPNKLLLGHILENCTSPRGNFACIEGKFILSRQMGYYLIQVTDLIGLLSTASSRAPSSNLYFSATFLQHLL